MFEFSRFYPRDYEHGRDFVNDLDAFLGKLPTDEWDFGVEIRNAGFLQEPYFESLARHNVGHVYNQWQRMPSLGEQLELSAARSAEMIEELEAKKRHIDEQIEELRLINKVCRQKIAKKKAP